MLPVVFFRLPRPPKIRRECSWRVNARAEWSTVIRGNEDPVQLITRLQWPRRRRRRRRWWSSFEPYGPRAGDDWSGSLEVTFSMINFVIPVECLRFRFHERGSWAVTVRKMNPNRGRWKTRTPRMGLNRTRINRARISSMRLNCKFN
jgi:hypothetical protein